MTLNFGGWLMALFQPKERRANRSADVSLDKCIQQNVVMRRTLVDFMNVTQGDMSDAEFRLYVQDQAHIAIHTVEGMK